MRLAVLGYCLLPAALFAGSSTVASAAPRPSDALVWAAAGDIEEPAGPLDRRQSPALTHADIRRAMTRVADWQLAHSAGRYNQDWTYTPLYLGLLATSRTTGDPRYHDLVLSVARYFNWTLLPDRDEHADDQSLAQVYQELYLEDPQPERLAATEARLRTLTQRRERPGPNLWWWCDALFMAPPALAELGRVRNDRRYIEFADREWDRTSAQLFDPFERLYFRDASYLQRREANGRPLFWSRGNGWVLAGKLRWLRALPVQDPLRAKYVRQFQAMAERIAELQPADGLWRMGLLDPGAYPMGEVSGTAFFTYAIAGGINDGLLDPARYRPVLERAWAGMLRNLHADGRLGAIQPIGSAPDRLAQGSSWVFGVGAFLLAGSELDRLVQTSGSP